MPEKITIGACWDGRDYYPKEYVNNLYQMVRRNTAVPFDFVLYVGPEAEKPGVCSGIDPAIRIVPSGLPYWWAGTRFWQPAAEGIDTATILYLDLDVVILKNIDDIINYPSEFAVSREFPDTPAYSGFCNNGNLGVSLIRNNAGAKVWEEYLKAGIPTWNPLTTHNRGKLTLAIQTIVNEPEYGIKKDLFPVDWICSYKYQVLKRGIPDDCRIVHFHGQPKQNRCLHEEFVKQNWR